MTVMKVKFFDESTWSEIVQFLPDNETVKHVVLDDFIWFVGRPKKYKSTKQKAEDYIKHLRLKSNVSFGLSSNEIEAFRSINIDNLESELIRLY